MKRIPNYFCLKCKQQLNRATHRNPSEPPPRQGDISICAHCGHIAVYNADFSLRYMTREELEMHKQNKPFWAGIQRASRKVKEAIFRNNAKLN